MIGRENREMIGKSVNLDVLNERSKTIKQGRVEVGDGKNLESANNDSAL